MDDDSTTRNRRIQLHQVPNSSVELELELESNYFPSDVVIGILSRLPVKTLFRFKSACSNWDAMINRRNSHLVSMHLKNYTDNPATEASIVCRYYTDYNPGEQGPGERSVSLCPGGPPPMNLDEPMLEQVICGTGNGLFLVRNWSDSNRSYSLWNRATREIRLLPDPDPLVKPQTYFYGVGLDLIANDIKIVLIRGYSVVDYNQPSKFASLVFTYTTRSNCWRLLDQEEGKQLGIVFLRSSSHIYVKGFSYWLDLHFRTHRRRVMAFDMGNNIFHKIDYPFHHTICKCKLGRYGDSVALFNGQQPDFSILDVWLLSSTRDGQWSWIKHSSIDSFPRPFFSVKGFWNDHQLIAQTRGYPNENQLVLYDTSSREIKVLLANCYTGSMHIYKESLL